MDVSIIFVNYQRPDHVIKSIASVLAHTDPKISYEVIVVDNASQDESCAQISARFPDVHIIRSEINIGFGLANNLGIAASSGTFVLLLNPDTWLLTDACAKFLDFMIHPANARVACCGAALQGPAGEQRVSYGNFPTLYSSFSEIGFYRFYRHYYYRNWSTALVKEDEALQEVDYVSGAAMFIRRSVLVETGGFDGDFFLYFEETELCYRIRKNGYSIMLLPSVKIVHLEGGSMEGTVGSSKKAAYFSKSRNCFLTSVMDGGRRS